MILSLTYDLTTNWTNLDIFIFYKWVFLNLIYIILIINFYDVFSMKKKYFDKIIQGLNEISKERET